MYGDVAVRVRDSIREICKTLDVKIVEGHVSKDRIRLLVSVPSYMSISRLLRNMKGKTSRKLLNEYRRLSKSFWGRRLWARGYFAASSGNVTDEAVAEYIAIRDSRERARDDGFSIGKTNFRMICSTDGFSSKRPGRFAQRHRSVLRFCLEPPRQKRKAVDSRKYLDRFLMNSNDRICLASYLGFLFNVLLI